MVKMKIILLLATITIASFSFNAFAEGHDLETPVVLHKSYDKLSGKPKVFIEGARLDFDFLRRNMKFVDFVSEPAVADVHIIITTRVNGGGGIVYSLMYTNKTFENLNDFTLTCTTYPGDTQEEKRKTIANTLSMGLMPFANQSNVSSGLSIRYKGKEEGQTAQTTDPWNQWTFRGGFNGNIKLEERRNDFNYSYNLRADKVTENWKFRSFGRTTVRTREYENDGESYRSENISSFVYSSIVKSLSPRWSAGSFFSYHNSNYSNIVYSISVKPAIEYNIFPWDISDRKAFTLAYYIGPEWKNYYEETIYGKQKEGLWEQTFKLDLQLVQTWGEIEAELNASNYMHDFTKNRITLDTELSVRIVRGFSVNFEFRAENIHDQIYLPKSEASLEDILLNRVKLPSSYEIYTGVGVRVQFGSIYNNIVNNRL